MGWLCQTSSCSHVVGDAAHPFLSGGASPLLLPALHLGSLPPGREKGPLEFAHPLGTYNLGPPQMLSLFPRVFTPCPCGLFLALGAEYLGWGWDVSIKQKAACQFFTRPDFALGLVLT